MNVNVVTYTKLQNWLKKTSPHLTKHREIWKNGQGIGLRMMANVETERASSGPKALHLSNTVDVGKKNGSRPFCVGPKSRTMSSAELRWLCEEQGRGFEEDLDEDRGSPSSSRLSVLSSLSICSSIDSSSDSSPAESRLPRCMLTSRLRRRILLMKVSVRYASTHNCVHDDC